MEEGKKEVETAVTENNAGKVEPGTTQTNTETVVENQGFDATKQYTQKEFEELVNKAIQDKVESRLARAKRNWEDKKKSEPKSDGKYLKQVQELQLKNIEYEKQLALAKYDIPDDFKEFVSFKIKNNVSKNKTYAQAVEEFFADEANKKYLNNGEKQAITTPRIVNAGKDDGLAKQREALRKAMGLK